MKNSFSWLRGFGTGMLGNVILIEAFICKVLWRMYKDEKKAKNEAEEKLEIKERARYATKTE